LFLGRLSVLNVEKTPSGANGIIPAISKAWDEPKKRNVKRKEKIHFFFIVEKYQIPFFTVNEIA
jgi:hypothetical protein